MTDVSDDENNAAAHRRRKEAEWGVEIEAEAGRMTSTEETAQAGAGEPVFGIGDLATEFGITTRTIRFYEVKGLITPQRAGTSRIYSKRDRARLILIMRGKRLGFSLEAIGEYLNLYHSAPDQAVQTRHLLGKIEASIADLEGKRRDIERTLAELGSIREQCLAALGANDLD